MICEREEEILAFKPREYWTVDAEAEKAGAAVHRAAHRVRRPEGRAVHDHERDRRPTRSRRARLETQPRGALTVANVEKKQRKRNPSPPFTTSTLQQEAARKLGFGAQRTMRTAQRLYEGVDFGEGPVGLITYMRTDSVNLARRGGARDPRRDRPAVRRGGAARRAAHLQDQVEERAGSARGHPPDVGRTHARAARRQDRRRPAQALHADLAARGGEPDGGRGVRHRRRRSRGRRRATRSARTARRW